jgi:xanthine dehydrogenase accessory factor
MRNVPTQYQVPTRATGCIVLVKGVGDVGSAVAHVLFHAGLRPVIVDVPTPSVTRRRMSFADALFEGVAVLEGVRAVRVDDSAALLDELARGQGVPVAAFAYEAVHSVLRPAVVVDARMRKQAVPEIQIDEAPLTIGLGPGFRAGQTVHAAVETNWGESLGEVLWSGEPEAYTGQPREIFGFARERYLYAPHAGTFHTTREIGTVVGAGETVAWVDTTPLQAQIGGVIRGVTRDGVQVGQGAKVVDIDPRRTDELLEGIGERPRRIAEGVLAAIQTWRARFAAR